MTDGCNFTDNTTFIACDGNLKYFVERLKHDQKLAREWFENNYIKLNEDKCHHLDARYAYETLMAKIGETRI